MGYIIYGALGNINVAALREIGTNFIVVEEGVFSSRLVAEGERASVPVFVWTVNDEDKMEEFYGGGASAVITDYPDSASRVLEEMEERGLFEWLADDSGSSSLAA